MPENMFPRKEKLIFNSGVCQAQLFGLCLFETEVGKVHHNFNLKSLLPFQSYEITNYNGRTFPFP